MVLFHDTSLLRMIGVSEKLNNYYLEELQKPNIGVVKNTQFGVRFQRYLNFLGQNSREYSHKFN